MVSIKKLGKYEIAKPLGSGGMGSVYLGKDAIIGRFVAIKVLNIEAEGELEKSDVESFFNEAKVAGTLIHPNIVTIFDAGIEEGIPFIVMEFFDGVPLSRFIETRELSAKEKLEILKKIGDAIDFAHSKGVIHRDIKPANILINDNKEVKIADFGIARILSSHKLKQSVAIGTPAYIAPEQAIGDAIDQRADIFSFAVVAYELLSGVPPFLGNDYNSTLYNILYAEPREPRNLREAGIDEKKWKQVFDRALSKRPEKRFSTAKDLVSALEEVSLKDRALKPLKKAEDAQVITRTLAVSRKKFKFYIFYRYLFPDKLFLNLFSAKNLRIIVPAVLLIILIPLIFVLMQGKREVKKEEILPPVKVEEKIEEKKEPQPLEAVEATPVQTQEIVLQIFSDPPHARVLVDGLEMGETPLFIPMKEKGEITIRLEKSGYLPSTRKVLIDPAEGDRKIEITLKPVETISINLDVITEPEGARVFIDGRLIGITPVRAFPLQYGTHSINVEKDGYTPRQDEVKVIKSGKQTVSFVLEPLQKIEEERIPSVGELVEMTEKVVRPKRISGDFPSTPSNFRKRGRFSVTLSFIVDEKGNVKEINIEESSGEPDLDLAAMRALQNWKFTSPTLKGIKVKVRLRQKFTFVIE